METSKTKKKKEKFNLGLLNVPSVPDLTSLYHCQDRDKIDNVVVFAIAFFIELTVVQKLTVIHCHF